MTASASAIPLALPFLPMIDLRSYVFGLMLLAWPTFIILGALFFALAGRVRHIVAVYVALVALLVAYFAASAMFGDLESQRTAAWLDPFGLTAFDLQTRYWTIAEKNSRTPALSGEILWNRVVWLSLSVAVLAWAVGSFRYDHAARRRKRGVIVEAPPSIEPIRWIRERPTFARGTPWAQFASQLRLETRFVVRSLPFVLIVAFGLINVLANIGYLDLMMGTPVWPVTHLMLVAISAGYVFLLNIIITFFAGEMVWRERNLRLEGVVDALPVPTWAFLLAKLFALWAAAGVFIASGMVALMGYQLVQGYTHLEPGLYAQGLVVTIVPFLLSSALALFFQAIANQKFVGYLLMVLYLVSGGVLAALHFDHHLYRYAGTPGAPYSDMNGWGHFVAPLFWFNAYWALAAGVLLCLAHAAWVRSYDSSWRSRWRSTGARLHGPALALLLLLVAGFVTTGAFIFYNTTC